MKCPFCGAARFQVQRSTEQPRGTVARIRRCSTCKRKRASIEILVEDAEAIAWQKQAIGIYKPITIRVKPTAKRPAPEAATLCGKCRCGDTKTKECDYDLPFAFKPNLSRCSDFIPLPP